MRYDEIFRKLSGEAHRAPELRYDGNVVRFVALAKGQQRMSMAVVIGPIRGV